MMLHWTDWSSHSPRFWCCLTPGCHVEFVLVGWSGHTHLVSNDEGEPLGALPSVLNDVDCRRKLQSVWNEAGRNVTEDLDVGAVPEVLLVAAAHLGKDTTTIHLLCVQI